MYRKAAGAKPGAALRSGPGRRPTILRKPPVDRHQHDHRPDQVGARRDDIPNDGCQHRRRTLRGRGNARRQRARGLPAKKRQVCRVTLSNRSSRRSAPIRMMARLPNQPPSRQHAFSAASRLRKRPPHSASGSSGEPGVEDAIRSTSSFRPYCAATAQNAPPTTARKPLSKAAGAGECKDRATARVASARRLLESSPAVRRVQARQPPACAPHVSLYAPANTMIACSSITCSRSAGSTFRVAHVGSACSRPHRQWRALSHPG